MNNYSIFSKFKEENCHIYEKVKNILAEILAKFCNIIYFDDVDIYIKDILPQYSLLERQILLRNLISENYSKFENSFEIFSKSRGEKTTTLFLNKTTLNVLELIKNSEGYFELY